MVALLESCAPRSELCGSRTWVRSEASRAAPQRRSIDLSWPGPRGSEGEAPTTPPAMFPSVAMMAIQSSTASFDLEDLGGSSGSPWPLEAASDVGGGVKKESTRC